MALRPLAGTRAVSTQSRCQQSLVFKLALSSPSHHLIYLQQPITHNCCSRKVPVCLKASRMGDGAEWEHVLQENFRTHPTEYSAAADSSAITPTPHPAAASSLESGEWEAVLLATENAVPRNQQQHSQETVYAVIECGSHSTRMLLHTGRSELARITLDTQLGASSTSTSSSAAALEENHVLPASQESSSYSATFSALEHYRSILDQHNVIGVAAVATAAVREAADADYLIAAASSILGNPLKVLSGEEEGTLAFIGATSSLAPSGCICLMIDLGGRSTELAVGIAGQTPQHVISLPLGCLAMQAAAEQAASQNGVHQRMGHNFQAPNQQQEAQQLMECAQQVLSAHADVVYSVTANLQMIQQQGQLQQQEMQQHRTQGEVQRQGRAARGTAAADCAKVVATGGTITTLAALLQQLPEYCHEAVHMSSMTQKDVEHLLQQLQDDDCRIRIRRDHPWLTEARVNSLAPGCAGVLALMQRLGVQEVTVSDCDLLDGVLMQMKQ